MSGSSPALLPLFTKRQMCSMIPRYKSIVIFCPTVAQAARNLNLQIVDLNVAVLLPTTHTSGTANRLTSGIRKFDRLRGA